MLYWKGVVSMTNCTMTISYWLIFQLNISVAFGFMRIYTFSFTFISSETLKYLAENYWEYTASRSRHCFTKLAKKINLGISPRILSLVRCRFFSLICIERNLAWQTRMFRIFQKKKSTNAYSVKCQFIVGKIVFNTFICTYHLTNYSILLRFCQN